MPTLKYDVPNHPLLRHQLFGSTLGGNSLVKALDYVTSQ